MVSGPPIAYTCSGKYRKILSCSGGPVAPAAPSFPGDMSPLGDLMCFVFAEIDSCVETFVDVGEVGSFPFALALAARPRIVGHKILSGCENFSGYFH